MKKAQFYTIIKKNQNEDEYRIQVQFPTGENKMVKSSSKKIDLVRQPESGYMLCCYDKDQTENLKNQQKENSEYKCIPDYEMHNYGFDFRA